jgi:outer membrane protein OmpA-like peptidoglycan-associated protein
MQVVKIAATPTPEAAPVLSNDVQVTKTDEGYSYVMKGDILFETDSFEVKEEAKPAIQEIAAILVKHPKDTMTVLGHTDKRGTKKHNLKLSQKRAQSVKDILVKEGVAEESVAIVGMGASEPVATNDTAEGMSKNRRVELKEKRAEEVK